MQRAYLTSQTLEFDDELPELNYPILYSEDEQAEFTGLYDHTGNKIYVISSPNKIGFDLR